LSLLTVDNLHVSYGAIRALHGVSLEVQAGEIVTLIGSNGAGKTTLLRAISGLLKPVVGRVTFDGKAMTGRPPHAIVERGLSHVPEGRQVFPQLTVRENLLLGGYLRHKINRPPVVPPPVPVEPLPASAPSDGLDYATPRRRAAEPDLDVASVFDLFPVLRERRDQKAGTLSGGEQQMLAIGRALMQRPKLLLLDEPSLGLAPLIVRRIFEIVREINAAGTTIFLVEQNAHLALQIAHRAYVLQTGAVIKSDAANKLLEDEDVKRAYLGG